MSNLSLTERVAALEKEVAELKAAQNNGTRKKDWRRTIGMFTGNDGMKQVFEEAMKLREKDREKARRRYQKRRKAPKS